MSPQASNRQALLNGTLRCIEERGYEGVRTRDIAKEAGANVASISYHFGSKDRLMAAALAEGFRRWLAEFKLLASPGANAQAHLERALETLNERLGRRRGLAHAFIAALSRSLHDEELRAVLAGAFAEMRSELAQFLELDFDGRGKLRASLLIATFDGMLIQWLIDPERGRADIAKLPELLGEALRMQMGEGMSE